MPIQLRKAFEMKKYLLILVIFVLMAIVGCQDRCPLVLEENKTLSDQNQQLKKDLDQVQIENLQLTKQLMNLSGISPEVRLEHIITVEDIELAKRTGLFDKDYNSAKESLIVYLKTIDKFGDSIKGAGIVDVELWDLSLPTEQAKLKSWHISPEELKENWAGSMMTSYYRLTFDVDDILKTNEGVLTVKIRFLDYLTGKSFEKQRAIER